MWFEKPRFGDLMPTIAALAFYGSGVDLSELPESFWPEEEKEKGGGVGQIRNEGVDLR